MPIYHMVCPTCGTERRFLTTLQKLLQHRVNYPCVECGTFLERRPEGPGAKMVERLDNGVMPRAVERPENVEELLDEEICSNEAPPR